jgi:hypothetical protein
MDGLALIFVNIDGHWLRVDRIESIRPGSDGEVCYIKMISETQSRPYFCSPEHVLQEISRVMAMAHGIEPEQQDDALDLDSMEEPPSPSTTRTRGGDSWGRP